MPRYYFNVHDGYSRPDKEGTELPDLQTARREAVRLAGMILAHEVDRLSLGEDWRLEVTDATGLILFRLDFSLNEAAAVTGRRRSGADGRHGSASA